MHRYSTNESRVTTYGVIAVAAVVLSWGIVKLLSLVSWPEWLVSVPAVTGSYALLYGLFDGLLWRVPVIRALGLSSTPDVSGTYEGQLASTFRDDGGRQVSHPIRITVEQSWTRIRVLMTVGAEERSSGSVSFMASVAAEGSATRLGYCYRNKINPAVADADMGDHEGTADLAIDAQGVAHGRYYNSRPRTGSIDTHRV